MAPVAPAAPEPPPPSGPRTPTSDGRLGWRRVLESLSKFTATGLDDRAGFDGYEGGVLTLVVRSETHRSWVREQLGSVDFASFFASFRNVDVRVAVEGVAIGRERRAAEDDRRRSDARESAEKSVVVRQLLEAFGARIETVEPAALAARDTFASLEEDHDE